MSDVVVAIYLKNLTHLANCLKDPPYQLTRTTPPRTLSRTHAEKNHFGQSIRYSFIPGFAVQITHTVERPRKIHTRHLPPPQHRQTAHHTTRCRENTMYTHAKMYEAAGQSAEFKKVN